MNEQGERYERLGFLALNSTEPVDSYIGALLVTDTLGIPLEFRATHPVKPTAIQRTLYGNTLEPHIGVSLCGRQLLKSSEQRPQLVFVNKEFLIDLREEVSIPIVFCREGGQAVLVSDGEVERTPSVRVEPLGAGLSPLIVSVHGLDSDILDDVRGFIEKVTMNLDVLEPFKRISEALKVLSKQDKRFQ